MIRASHGHADPVTVVIYCLVNLDDAVGLWGANKFFGFELTV